MQDLLKDIGAVVGVQGCFLCDSNGQLLAREGSAVDQVQLETVAQVLTQTIDAVSLARRRKVGDIDLVYQNGRLLAKNIGEACLCIQGAPSLNVPLLNLTANLVARKVKERMKQGAVPSAAPGDPAGAVSSMGAFIEQLMAEFGDQGIGRGQMITIAKHRMGKLARAFPFMKAARISDDRVDLSQLPVDQHPPEQLGQAIRALVHGLGVSARGIMGESEATATYLGVYMPFYSQHQAAFETLGLGDSLKGVMSEAISPTFAGVDIKLD